MLTFYYHPLSPIARRVWIALLEKEIEFEPVVVDLRGKQFEDSFLALNPFHHVPVIVHDGLRVIESLAILDYLELRFPVRSLMPTTPVAVANMRMVQMVVMNELVPKLVACAIADEENPLPAPVAQHVSTCCEFLEAQLSDQVSGQDFFGGDAPNLADVVAGATLPLFVRLGLSMQPYPSLAQWHQRLMQRNAWQQTEPTAEKLRAWQKWIQLQVRRQQRKAK
ncbi:MAG: glutathione S-transferase family protein [Phormidesmis sp.]